MREAAGQRARRRRRASRRPASPPSRSGGTPGRRPRGSRSRRSPRSPSSRPARRAHRAPGGTHAARRRPRRPPRAPRAPRSRASRRRRPEPPRPRRGSTRARAPSRRRGRGPRTRSRARARRGCRRRRPRSAASCASSSRQFEGCRPDCASRRTASAPRRKPSSPAKRTRGAGAEARPVLEAHPGLGDHAEDALGAYEQAVRGGPGPRGRQPSRLDDTRRCQHAQRLHEVVDVGVERRVVAARARRDPAAEARELEALREVAQREAVRAQLRPRAPGRARRPGCARRARCGRSRARGRAGRGRGSRPPAAPRDRGLDAAHHRGAAAVGYRVMPSASHQSSTARTLGFVAREGDLVGRARELAPEGAHHVAVRLAVVVPGARLGVVAARSAASAAGGRTRGLRSESSSMRGGGFGSSATPKRAPSVCAMARACSADGPGALHAPAPELALHRAASHWASTQIQSSESAAQLAVSAAAGARQPA